MRFVKMQGTGNDFLLVQPEGERDWAALARAMCDRHFGAGADGLMLVLPSQRADVRMRLFNPDGAEAEVSGNGIRCLVKNVVERGLAKPKDGRVTVEAVHGVLEAQVLQEDGRVTGVRLSMGAPRLAPDEVPVIAEREPVLDLPLEVAGRRMAVACVSMGNPHAVLFQEESVDRFPLELIGPQVENHAAFPERVNFGVARLIDRDRMELRVWERGAGETLACGSGSCAATVAARLKGLAGERVTISQPGGQLTVEWDGKGEVFLAGPAQFVFEGEWPE